MLKYFLLLSLVSCLICGCHGCSFIKEKVLGGSTQKQNEEQYQDDTRKDSGPIPVNPSHS